MNRAVLDPRSTYLVVELTNRCNLRCEMCPTKNLQRPFADMPFWLVEKVARDAKAHGLKVAWLHHLGEPLLYDRLAEAIELFPGCSVSSNAMLLDQEKAKMILSSSLQRIRLCLDTINESVYPQIRRGGDFPRVVANIRNFLEMSKGSSIQIEIQRLTSLATKQESVNDFINFFDLGRFPNAKVLEKPCEPLDTSDETPLHKRFCGCLQGRFFHWFNILADGRVTHCCYDANGQQIIGDLKIQSIAEIADSPELAKLEKAFRAKDWRPLPRCAECYKYAGSGFLFYDQLRKLAYKVDRVIPIMSFARFLAKK